MLRLERKDLNGGFISSGHTPVFFHYAAGKRHVSDSLKLEKYIGIDCIDEAN